MKLIEVVVSPKGGTTVQTRGFAGAGCQQASKSIEQALGVIVAEQKTPEYFIPAQVEQSEVRT